MNANVETSQVEAIRSMTNKQMVEAILSLTQRVEELEKKTTPKTVDSKEMTDDDARSILFGELKDTKHKEAGEKLGLTYGQIYSCRLGFTFKAIHKEMKEKGIENKWMKK